MSEPLPPPGETPPVEGSTAEAHHERPDGGIWEHPYLWLVLITIGCLLVAAFFLVRVITL
ncbi:DUF6480 family protein [Streptomyces chromofuscus]|uniref:Uncharacterized protein n=1 Tax=Streptomyces chromofuscus TaxID=42881 RepID=A0A7M2T7V1_STRCW|nr:DUF6480 family protein [Streptomyces chromofuscus]QOV44189.1 hypothetical protein IPT68_31860 [Streptomyces chromofuscus]GGT31904.1 hypothetical protein GCM10010254_60650 [Streptomyces chromofuscus]